MKNEKFLFGALGILLAILLAILLGVPLVGCVSDSINDTHNDCNTVRISEFQVEVVGKSFFDGRAYLLYRDVVTDILFIAPSEAGSTMTVMPNPETGLPMTYTQYKALCDQSQTTENTD